MPTAVMFYDVVLWLHITAVVVGFGATFAFGVMIAAGAAESPRSIPALIAGTIATTRTLVTGGGIVILVTGIYLAADRWEGSEFFIAFGGIAILALLGLAHGFFIPNDRKAKAAAERDIAAADQAGRDVEYSEEFNRLSGASAKVGMFAGILVVITVYVMTAKPFL